MRYWWWNFGSGGMVFAILLQITFWIMIIRIISNLIQRYWKKAREDEAVHILKKKYANWEISKKEYLEKKKDLI
ncbi:MAG: hypothetical protein ACD_80C00016G0004 [uncultured bacterium (gcode 4)]|uniref:SHOCT domain-containing protein n=1 Tax=uncultured bacterium (gcode 4) TaxID=1234023 RepID=K1XK87_9BACT|nr:MAG: hypothetical protein ACD_80C00016G0004 [uncultured bacterium (gcode 4)]